MLLSHRQAGVEGQYLVVGQAAGGAHHILDSVGGIADFTLAREENQNVAGGFFRKLPDGVKHALNGVAVVVLEAVTGVRFVLPSVAGAGFAQGAVADLDGVGAAGDLNDGRGVIGQGCLSDFFFFGAEGLVDDADTGHKAGGEMAGETLGVDSG